MIALLINALLVKADLIKNYYTATQEIVSIFCAVSKAYYRDKESPLDEHGHDYMNIVVHAYGADGSRARGGGEF